jgi:4a-hydroxytetrahydrobiopterin dehydratase
MLPIRSRSANVATGWDWQTRGMSWEERDGSLQREFVFRDFNEAFGFMTRVALLAEQLGHHPDWSNSWNRVRITLTTHDAGNQVTELDRRLAAAIDALVR